MESRVTRTEQVYKGRVVDLRIDEVVLPNGVTTTLEIVRHGGASAVVALDGEGQVTLLRQFRHAVGGYIWEVPAGKLDGDDPAACAIRELEEEAGLATARLTRLGSIVTTPGFSDERIHIFLAEELSSTQQNLEEYEVLSVSSVPLQQALAMIRHGEIEDAKSIVALHLAAEFIRHRDQ